MIDDPASPGRVPGSLGTEDSGVGGGHGHASTGPAPETGRNLCSFWLLGICNNSSYVIMLAGANTISGAAVGLVFLAAVLPAVVVKATAPYWFHAAPYAARVCAAAALMALSFFTVALGRSRPVQLLGVAFASVQGGLGEASVLALTSRYSGPPAITAWSSGTGFAGVFGYAWVAALHLGAGLPFPAVILAANVTVAAWLGAYFWLLGPPAGAGAGTGLAPRPGSPRLSGSATFEPLQVEAPGRRRGRGDGSSVAGSWAGADVHPGAWEEGGDGGRGGSPERQRLIPGGDGSSSAPSEAPLEPKAAAAGAATVAARLTPQQRARHVAALWPYMAPLALVYFAEYAMQSGTWAAIGFPVESLDARRAFYVYGNWAYQIGVFVSRSSGMHFQASMPLFWAMPVAQVLFLVFFLAVAILKPAPLYSYFLLGPCFITGLLGGAVYVNAFTLLSRRVEPAFREFSLAAVSLADSLGVALADVAGVLIQGCLFKVNGLPGADFKC